MKDFVLCIGITIFLIWCIVVIKSCLPNMKEAKTEYLMEQRRRFKMISLPELIWLDIRIVIATLTVIVIGPFLIIYGAIAKERSNRRWNRENFKNN